MIKPQGLIILALLLVNVTIAGLAEKPKVISTMTIIADMAKNIGGDYFEIDHIVPVGGDPHLYDPIPQDAQKVVGADLVLMNGLTLEGWLTEFIKNSGTKAKVVTVTEGVKTITGGDYHNAPDPHAWMDVLNGLVYAENIKNALITLSPDNQEGIEANYIKYKAALEATHKTITAKINAIPAKKRVLITSHDAFQYFGQRYGIRLEAILGTSTEAEAQTSDINRIYKIIDDTDVSAVFIESTINPKMLKQIAADKGVTIGGSLFADSLGDPEGKSGTYIGMLSQNATTISEALIKERLVAQTGGQGGENWLVIGIISLLFLGGITYMFAKMNR